MIRILIILLGITFICLLGAFFATPEFTMSCSTELLSCLEEAYPMSFFQKLTKGFQCVFANIWCVFNQFKEIF